MATAARPPEIRSLARAIEFSRPRTSRTAISRIRRIESIEFRDVSIAYKEGQSVLEDFSLSIEPGQSIALVGPAVIALASPQALIVVVGVLYFVAAAFCHTRT